MTKSSKPIVLQCHWSVDCNAYVAKSGKETYIIWIDENKVKSKKRQKQAPKSVKRKAPYKHPTKLKLTKSRKSEIIALINSGISEIDLIAKFPHLDKTKLSQLYQGCTTLQSQPATPPQFQIAEPNQHQAPGEVSKSNLIAPHSATPKKPTNSAPIPAQKHPFPPRPGNPTYPPSRFK